MREERRNRRKKDEAAVERERERKKRRDEGTKKEKERVKISYILHIAQYNTTVYNIPQLPYTLSLQLIAGTNFSVFALRVFGIIILILAIFKFSSIN